ncbi:MAG: FliG C-terminal domain-containing protein [Hyphomonas sp.]
MSAQPKPDLAAARIVPLGSAQTRPAAKGSTITPSQRVAVIIALLGESAAKPIVEKLDDAALAKVATALQDISFIARDEMVGIIVDFLTHLRKSSGAMRGGREKAREVLSGLLDAERLAAVMGEEIPGGPSETAPEASTENPWVRLAKKEPKQIAHYLDGLTPNIIGLILRKLDVSIASEVLGHMNGDKLDATIGFMVEGQTHDPGIDLVLARMIEMEFLNAEQGGPEEDSEHLSEIGELLSLIPADKRESLMKFLESQHESKLKLIQQSMFTMEGLPTILPITAVPVAFREMDEETTIKLLVSLRGSYAEVSEFLLGNISARLADKLRDELTDAKDLTPAQAEAVQRDFLSSLMSLKRRGLIELVKPEEE